MSGVPTPPTVLPWTPSSIDPIVIIEYPWQPTGAPPNPPPAVPPAQPVLQPAASEPEPTTDTEQL